MTTPTNPYVIGNTAYPRFPEGRPVARSAAVLLMAMCKWRFVAKPVAEWARDVEDLGVAGEAPAPRTIYTHLEEFARRGLVQRRLRKRRVGDHWCRPAVYYQLESTPVDAAYALRLVQVVYALGLRLPANAGPSVPSTGDGWTALIEHLPESLLLNARTAIAEASQMVTR